jgi:hypothetical protein
MIRPLALPCVLKQRPHAGKLLKEHLECYSSSPYPAPVFQAGFAPSRVDAFAGRKGLRCSDQCCTKYTLGDSFRLCHQH